MRAYVLINGILSSIQQGIQGGHAMIEMARKYHEYKGNEGTARMFWDWADMHRTVVFCNGGFNDSIRSWHKLIFNGHHPYPRGAFREDGATLGGLMTAIAIVLPEHVYQVMDELRKGAPLEESYEGFTPFDYEIVQRLAKTRLAS